MDDFGEQARPFGLSLLHFFEPVGGRVTDGSESWRVVDAGGVFWTFGVRSWLGTVPGSEQANGTSLASMHPGKT